MNAIAKWIEKAVMVVCGIIATLALINLAGLKIFMWVLENG